MSNIPWPLANPKIGFPKTITSDEGQLCDIGGVCSALWATRELEATTYADLKAFHAPSECYPLAFKGIDKTRMKIAKEWGWTLDELRQELERRLSIRWIHYSGFYDMLPNGLIVCGVLRLPEC